MPDTGPQPLERVITVRIIMEWVDLYLIVPYPGENIPVVMESFDIRNKIMEEGEIKWALKFILSNKSRGVYGVGAEDLKACLAEARVYELLKNTQWQKGVDIFQAEFCNRKITDKATCQAIALLPKGGVDLYVISLV